MRILITGATGFVGSVLIPELAIRFGPSSLSAFVLPGEKIPEAWQGQKIRVFYGDIADREAVRHAFKEQTHVIHLAGIISYWKKDFDNLMRVNRDGVNTVVEACLEHGIQRLVHISSVGAIGFYKDGKLADETVPFNWPSRFYYMASKYEGQRIVEKAVKERGLKAIILNPASIMGPGDPNIQTPYNQLFAMVYKNNFFGSFSGGLAVVDVRDLTAIIIKALERGAIGERYLVTGSNLTYQDVIRLIGKYANRKVWPLRIPPFFLMAGGAILEMVSGITGKRPLMTYAYGRLSGWKTYYSNEKSKKEFSHTYLDIEQTIRDSCAYFEKTFAFGERSH